jgi:DNA-binding MarR family transcriptional regulator
MTVGSRSKRNDDFARGSADGAATVYESDPWAVKTDESLQGLDLHRMPGYLFRRLDSRAAALYEACTGQSTLTPRQFGLLLVVHQAGVVRQNDLARRLHLDPSTLGEMIVRMIDRSLLLRKASQSDRRTSELELTDEGREALFSHLRGALDAQAAIMAPLPHYLRPVFLKCLEILAYSEDELESELEQRYEAGYHEDRTGAD